MMPSTGEPSADDVAVALPTMMTPFALGETPLLRGDVVVYRFLDEGRRHKWGIGTVMRLEAAAQGSRRGSPARHSPSAAAGPPARVQLRDWELTMAYTNEEMKGGQSRSRAVSESPPPTRPGDERSHFVDEEEARQRQIEAVRFSVSRARHSGGPSAPVVLRPSVDNAAITSADDWAAVSRQWASSVRQPLYMCVHAVLYLTAALPLPAPDADLRTVEHESWVAAVAAAADEEFLPRLAQFSLFGRPSTLPRRAAPLAERVACAQRCVLSGDLTADSCAAVSDFCARLLAWLSAQLEHYGEVRALADWRRRFIAERELLQNDSQDADATEFLVTFEEMETTAYSTVAATAIFGLVQPHCFADDELTITRLEVAAIRDAAAAHQPPAQSRSNSRSASLPVPSSAPTAAAPQALGDGIYLVRLEAPSRAADAAGGSPFDDDDDGDVDMRFMAALAGLLSGQKRGRRALELAALQDLYDLHVRHACERPSAGDDAQALSAGVAALLGEEEAARVATHVAEAQEHAELREFYLGELQELRWGAEVHARAAEVERLRYRLRRRQSHHLQAAEVLQGALNDTLEKRDGLRERTTRLMHGMEVAVELLGGDDCEEDEDGVPMALPEEQRADMSTRFREYSYERELSRARAGSQVSVSSSSVAPSRHESYSRYTPESGNYQRAGPSPSARNGTTAAAAAAPSDDATAADDDSEVRRLRDLLSGERLRREELEARLAAIEEAHEEAGGDGDDSGPNPFVEMEKVRSGIVRRLHKQVQEDTRHMGNIDQQVQHLQLQIEAAEAVAKGAGGGGGQDDDENSEVQLLRRRVKVLQNQRDATRRNRDVRLHEIEQLKTLLRSVHMALEPPSEEEL